MAPNPNPAVETAVRHAMDLARRHDVDGWESSLLERQIRAISNELPEEDFLVLPPSAAPESCPLCKDERRIQYFAIGWQVCPECRGEPWIPPSKRPAPDGASLTDLELRDLELSARALRSEPHSTVSRVHKDGLAYRIRAIMSRQRGQA